MRASELVILRCAVVPFKQKILAEDEPLTRASRAGDKFSNHWGETTRTRICMLGTDLLALSCSFKYPQARLVRIPGQRSKGTGLRPSGVGSAGDSS
jgi:hypothetical protein